MDNKHRSPNYFDMEPLLQLPKTRLVVVGSELQRISSVGTVVLRIPLDEIQSIEFQMLLQPVGFLGCGVGVAFGIIAHYVSENNLVTVFLHVAAVLMFAFGTSGLYGRYIHVRTAAGVNTISCLDLTDEIEGFATSLRRMMAGREGFITKM